MAGARRGEMRVLVAKNRGSRVLLALLFCVRFGWLETEQEWCDSFQFLEGTFKILVDIIFFLYILRPLILLGKFNGANAFLCHRFNNIIIIIIHFITQRAYPDFR